MDIAYKTKRLEKVCTEFRVAQREYGPEMAEKIHQRVNEIRAAGTVEVLIQFGVGRCHTLTGDRKGHYAMDLVQPFRLTFEMHKSTMTCIRIINIEDYH